MDLPMEMNSAQSNKAQNDQPSPEDNEKSDRTPDRTPKILTEVKQVAREHTEAAIETLAAMINDESATTAARVAAARAILGRQDTPWADALRAAAIRAGEDGRLLLARIAEKRERRSARSAPKP